MKGKYLILALLILITTIGCTSERNKKVRAYLVAKKERTLGELTIAFCDKLAVLEKGMTHKQVSDLGPIILGRECEVGWVSKKNFRSLSYTFDPECRLTHIDVEIDCKSSQAFEAKKSLWESKK